MTQTPISKAIEQLKEKIENSNYALYAKGCEDAIDTLTDLLPYERDVIEGAYAQGREDELYSWQDDAAKHTDSIDYFTKTFINNAD